MSLQRLNLGAAVFIALSVACSDGDADRITAGRPGTAPLTAGRSITSSNAMQHNTELNWGPAPPIFPPGAQLAVVQGDPFAPGKIFTVRLIFPSGYVLAPHTHPDEEHVTVLRGDFLAGMGADFSDDALTPLQAGDFMTMPKDAPHFAKTRGITEVQVHGLGPFQLTYVHPEDDPTK